jgi:hypothetical protein
MPASSNLCDKNNSGFVSADLFPRIEVRVDSVLAGMAGGKAIRFIIRYDYNT